MAGPFTVRYVPVNVTTPAGTAIAAPVTTRVPIVDEVLVDVHLIIPRGHHGLTGIRLTLSGSQILPWDLGPSWITADNLEKSFDVGNQIGSLLNVVTYNLDIFDHQHRLLFKVTDAPTPAATSSPVQLVDIIPAG